MLRLEDLNEKDQAIIKALFAVAQTHPKEQITMQMIADEVGIRRESIIKYHFKNIQDMLETVHRVVDDEVFGAFETFVNGEDEKNKNIMDFFEFQMLPALYKRKDWLATL